MEESLQSSITLEALVASQPGGVLPIGMAWSVLEQLTSVVRSLHEPLRVCHRDIKVSSFWRRGGRRRKLTTLACRAQPENILVRVTPSLDGQSEPTLLLKLLDFGLATHFSASEPKLTTCCGSPAYHSPELWRGLREKSGSVRYWVRSLPHSPIPRAQAELTPPPFALTLAGSRSRHLVHGLDPPPMPHAAQVPTRDQSLLPPRLGG